MTTAQHQPPHRPWCTATTDDEVWRWMDQQTGAYITRCRSCRAEVIHVPSTNDGDHEEGTA